MKRPMSAFGGKADMAIALQNVRYWPKADIPSCTHMSAFGGKADIGIVTGGRHTAIPLGECHTTIAFEYCAA